MFSPPSRPITVRLDLVPVVYLVSCARSLFSSVRVCVRVACCVSPSPSSLAALRVTT